MFEKMFGKRKRRRLSLFLILMPFIVLIGVFGYIGYKNINSMLLEEEVPDNYYIESLNYKLRSNATEYQVDLFNELAESIEDGSDELKTAELIVKNFVADYFTWTNKAGSYDVGGAYYVYSPYHKNFVSENRDNLYKYISYYISEYGSESLIEVGDIVITSSKKSEDFYETKDGDLYQSFDITCDWSLKNNKFDGKTDFMESGYFKVIINGDGRYEIVIFY